MFRDVWNERRDQTLDEAFATNGIGLAFKNGIIVEGWLDPKSKRSSPSTVTYLELNRIFCINS